jgi:hypothetical protein
MERREMEIASWTPGDLEVLDKRNLCLFYFTALITLAKHKFQSYFIWRNALRTDISVWSILRHCYHATCNLLRLNCELCCYVQLFPISVGSVWIVIFTKALTSCGRLLTKISPGDQFLLVVPRRALSMRFCFPALTRLCTTASHRSVQDVSHGHLCPFPLLKSL